MPVNKNISQNDNTYVAPIYIPIKKKIPDDQLKNMQFKKLYTYDKQKTDFYSNLQDFYNQNFFGRGLQNNWQHLDPVTQEKQIQSNVNYGIKNIENLLSTILLTGITNLYRGLLPLISKRKTIGQLNDFLPYKINEGSESIVFKNSPTTVRKISTVGSGEMLKRNKIPNTQSLKFVGYTKHENMRFPTFIQKKLKILNNKNFNKYLPKLDKAMEKHGFKIINDPYVQYRAYSNGNIVISDIAPENVGINILNQPKIIDFSISSIPEWIKSGYSIY